MDLTKIVQEINRGFGEPFLPEGFVKARVTEGGTLWFDIGDRNCEFDEKGEIVGSGNNLNTGISWQVGRLMSPGHPEWQRFFELLEGPEGCNFRRNPDKYEDDNIEWDCSSKSTRYKSRAILERYFPGVDIEATMAFFDKHGGHCDCEILWNVYQSETPEDEKKRQEEFKQLLIKTSGFDDWEYSEETGEEIWKSATFKSLVEENGFRDTLVLEAWEDNSPLPEGEIGVIYCVGFWTGKHKDTLCVIEDDKGVCIEDLDYCASPDGTTPMDAINKAIELRDQLKAYQ